MTTLTDWADVVDAATSYLSRVDAPMAEARARIGPCTLTPNPNIFEALVDAIISQQISVKAADAIMARLRAVVGGDLVTPEKLLPLEHEALRAIGLSTPKARYLRDLTERIVGGSLDLEALERMPDEDVITSLVAVKGIGRWTAEMILIFSLARPDVLPVDDLGLVEGVRQAYHLETRPTRKELLERGEAWRPYRTFATWYMWAVRRLDMNNTRTKTRIVSL